MNKKTLQSGFDKRINGLLNLLPVSTLVADRQFIDRQASVHIEIK